MKRLTVRRRPGGKLHQGVLVFGGHTIPCCLGRSGIVTLKREGDGATPSGTFRLLFGFHRKDRIRFPQTELHLKQIDQNSGWCDDPQSPNYNQYVPLPFPQGHEKMLRQDRLYDICIVLDYNIHPRARNLGSAIFFHQASEGQKPTEGCVAIDPDHMRLLLPELTPQTEMVIYR